MFGEVQKYGAGGYEAVVIGADIGSHPCRIWVWGRGLQAGLVPWALV